MHMSPYLHLFSHRCTIQPPAVHSRTTPADPLELPRPRPYPRPRPRPYPRPIRALSDPPSDPLSAPYRIPAPIPKRGDTWSKITSTNQERRPIPRYLSFFSPKNTQ